MLSKYIAIKDAEPRRAEDIHVEEWLTIAGLVAVLIVLLTVASSNWSKRRFGRASD
jgi:hypothetical protein